MFSWQFRSSSSKVGLADATAATASIGATGAGLAMAAVPSVRDRLMHIDDPFTCVVSRGLLLQTRQYVAHVSCPRGHVHSLPQVRTQPWPTYLLLMLAQLPEAFKAPGGGAASADPVAAVAASDACLVVARSSGVVYRYSLPALAIEGQHLLRCRPHQMALNCDSSKLGIVDFGGTFSILDMHTSAAVTAGEGAAAQASPGANGALHLGGAGGKLRITGEHLTLERKVRSST